MVKTAAPIDVTQAGKAIQNQFSAQKDAALTSMPKQVLYVDTPIASTVSQVMPFYESGFFDQANTPLYLKRRPALSAQQLFLLRGYKGTPVQVLSRKRVRSLPVDPGGVVFYAFNSMSNMNTVSNRSFHHVLILHGESNKDASFRPAARIYDYVVVAGPLAKSRYLKHGIFTPAELNKGRVIMMGDSFVQTLPWIKPANKGAEMGSILYSPTWEGFGGPASNFSSVSKAAGFIETIRLAKWRKCKNVIVKPHPYLGTLKPWMISHFVRGVKMMKAAGLNVSVSLDGANFAVRFAVRFFLPSTRLQDATEMTPIEFGICDVSGMEAVFLKQKIPHIVLRRNTNLPDELSDIYAHKSMDMFGASDLPAKYFEKTQIIDDMHRQLVFGWQDPALESMTPKERNDWLNQFVKDDAYWRAAKASQ